MHARHPLFVRLAHRAVTAEEQVHARPGADGDRLEAFDRRMVDGAAKHVGVEGTDRFGGAKASTKLHKADARLPADR
eukprot:4485188-Prymnesium_polylepis.1